MQETTSQGVPRKAIFWAYEHLVVPFSVFIFLIYILELPEWKVYALAPMIVVTFFVFFLRSTFFFYDCGVIPIVWGFLKRIYEGTVIVFGVAINWINEFKISKIVWSLAILNLGLVLWYAWVNVNFFKLFQELAYLIRDLALHLSDPVKIMQSVDSLLERSHILAFFRWAKAHYLPTVMEEINRGNPAILLGILFTSIAGIAIGLVPSLFFKWWCNATSDETSHTQG